MEDLHTLSSPMHIVIAGGGASGWMAAAMLAKCLPSAQYRITLIEPPGARGLGVGEATIPTIVNLLRRLQASEFEMMQQCDATYKLGIQFVDWVQPEHENWHPFGVCGARIDGRDLFHFWNAQRQQTESRRPYHSYSVHWAASITGKGPHCRNSVSPISQTQSYAFHMNAEALAGWLRQRALRSSHVHELTGSVSDVQLDQQGDVSAVVLNTGHQINGDFFIDCTGFHSRLMAQALQDPFESWNRYLLCDRAVAFRIPARRTVPPYTTSRAMPAGWTWHIPLATSTGVGYVYSSQFITDDEALRQLRTAFRVPEEENIQPKFLKMRVGRQQHFWKNNVLAIGLAGGFLEPLESTGLHLTQVGIELFLELFPQGTHWSPLRDQYNRRMVSLYDEVRDFVQLHYWLSQRQHEPFWQAARETPLSGSLKRRLEIYDDCGMLDQLQPEAFSETSYYHLLTGCGRLPRRVSTLAMSTNSDQVAEIMQAIRQQNDAVLRELPLHEAILDHIHLTTSSAA